MAVSPGKNESCKKNNEHTRKLGSDKVQKLSLHNYKTLIQQSTYASKYLGGCNETVAFAVRCGSLQCIMW